MKLTGLLVASFATLILVTSSAFASQFGYECTADGKSITLTYSYSGGYHVDTLSIDGQDFTHSSKVQVFRGSGTVFTVANYRAGKSMYFGINTPSGTYYQLEGGAQYPMTCKSLPQPAAPAADDRL
jgi:hypothetical protein